MKTKYKIGLGIVILVVLIAGSIIYYELSVGKKSYSLDEGYKIIDSSLIPKNIDGNMISPAGYELEKIIIDADDPEIMDEPWTIGYYSASQDKFWIVNYEGGGPGAGVWYGPFEGKIKFCIYLGDSKRKIFYEWKEGCEKDD